MRTLISMLVVLLIGACPGCQGAEPARDGAAAASAVGLRPAQSIPLDGVEGRIDHLAYDAKNRRLYVAALGNNTVEVIDLKAGRRAGTIRGLAKPQGMAVLPEDGRVVVASGEDGKCRFYDDALRPLATVDGLDDADNVRYDPAAKLVYVGYGDGALAVIDAGRMAKVADVKLDGHPESFQLEPEGKRIFINVPSARAVEVVDRERRAVVARWRLADAGANFPMALDPAGNRLFVACRQPARVLVLDATSGQTVGRVDCCGDADDLFYDAEAKRLYVTGGEGCVSIIQCDDAPGSYRAAGRLPTADGARTSLFVPKEGALFVAVPHRGPQAAEIRVLRRE